MSCRPSTGSSIRTRSLSLTTWGSVPITARRLRFTSGATWSRRSLRSNFPAGERAASRPGRGAVPVRRVRRPVAARDPGEGPRNWPAARLADLGTVCGQTEHGACRDLSCGQRAKPRTPRDNRLTGSSSPARTLLRHAHYNGVCGPRQKACESRRMTDSFHPGLSDPEDWEEASCRHPSLLLYSAFSGLLCRRRTSLPHVKPWILS